MKTLSSVWRSRWWEQRCPRRSRKISFAWKELSKRFHDVESGKDELLDIDTSLGWGMTIAVA
jgi:hypothetical protein